MRWIDIIKKHLGQSPLLKNIAIMASGTGVAQIFPLLTIPIISRLYTPEEFGGYAIYYGIITVLTVITGLKFENVILIAKTEDKAFNALILTLLLGLVISCLSGAVFVLFDRPLAEWFNSQSVIMYFYLIPASLFVATTTNFLHFWFLRREQFKFLSWLKIFLAISSSLLQIIIGLIDIGVLGFILANIISYTLATFLYAYRLWKDDRKLFAILNWESMKGIIRRHIDFTLYTLPADFINNFAQQLPTFLLGNLFGDRIVGFYSLGQRVISFPLGFISTSIQDVFRQTASKEFAQVGTCLTTYYKTLKLLAYIAVPCLIGFVFFAPWVFAFVFGEEWLMAGTFVQILAPFFMIRFVASPLSYVFLLIEQQKIDLVWQIFFLMVTFASLKLGAYFFDNPLFTIAAYSASVFFVYVINLVISHRLATLKSHQPTN